MNFPLFILLTTLGSLIWNADSRFSWCSSRRKLGMIVHYMDIYSNIAYVIIAIEWNSGNYLVYPLPQKEGLMTYGLI